MRTALILLALAAPGQAQEAPPPAAPPSAPAPAATAKPAPRPAPVLQPTPVNERVLVIGALNKRSGRTQRFTLKPGQQVRFDGLTVIARSCEVTPPWEQKLTGAFLQIDERRLTRTGATAAPQRIFSGWMFAESPSLNVLESPRYDVWAISCTMRWPDRGPDTVSAGAPAKAASPAATPSIAKKSAETPKAPAN
jgi:hypothetical protein